MRQPRKLPNIKQDRARSRERLAVNVAAETIAHCMPEDIKCTMRGYIAKYPGSWWIRFNRDTGRVLENLFGSSFYAEQQFGEHNLKPEFLAIIERALNMG